MKFPTAAERQYIAIMLNLGKLTRKAYAPVFKALEKAVEIRDSKFDDDRIATIDDYARAARFDANEDIKAKMAEAGRRLDASLNLKRLRTFLVAHAMRLDRWNKEEFAKQAQSAVGVDVFATDPRIAKRAQTYAKVNATYITKLANDTKQTIGKTVLGGLSQGSTYASIAKRIEGNLDGNEARAVLIARDQTGKLYGQINSDRQRNLGVTRFVWRTSNDERVREDHAILEGQVFEYPQGAPSEGIPGEPIQCRCYAEPLFDFLAE